MSIPSIPALQPAQTGRARVLNWVLSLCGCVCLGLMSLYFSAGMYGLSLFHYYLTQPMVLVLNLLPYLLIFLFFFFLTGRSWIGFSVTGVITLIYSWAQYWKLMARSDAVYAEDLLLLSEAMQMSGKYISLNWKILLSAVLVIAGACVLFLLRKVVLSRKSRAVGCILAIALSVLAYQSPFRSAGIYNSMSLLGTPESVDPDQSVYFPGRDIPLPLLHPVCPSQQAGGL